MDGSYERLPIVLANFPVNLCLPDDNPPMRDVIAFSLAPDMQAHPGRIARQIGVTSG